MGPKLETKLNPVVPDSLHAATPDDILITDNGTSEKTVLTDDGTVDIAVPLTRR